MADYDLVVAGGTVVTPADMVRADVGIANGQIAAIGLGLPMAVLGLGLWLALDGAAMGPPA